MSRLKILILIFGCFLSVICLRDKNEKIIINISDLYEENMGKKGTLVLEVAESSMDIENTSKDTCFNTQISNEQGNLYPVKCGFWKARNQSLFIFCDIGEDIPAGKYHINLENTPEISYSGYTISFNQYSDFEFTKYDMNIIDLYSDKQTIIVEKDKENFELKFKISSYNQEPILINYLIIADCSQNNGELICKITKNQLEEILTPNVIKLEIVYINYISREKTFPLIPYIDVIYNDIEKINVYVGITKLIENVAEHDTLIAYETNITNINNVLTDLEAFELYFMNNNGEGEDCPCSFRKYDAKPLLLVCFVNKEGTNWLKEITEEKIYDNLNIKYNFTIQPVNNEEKIYFQRGSGTFIYWVHPELLDFTKSDSLIIEYGMESPSSLTGITFNENARDLNCQTIGKHVKRCTVPKSHFEGLKSGYYFPKHNNHLGTKSTSYENPPVKVILDDSTKNIGNMNSFTLYHWLLLILIMV